MLSCAPNMKYSLFSFSIVSLKSHGERWPRGSMETIFFLSAHWGNGPMLAAGSVLVKSGLDQESAFPYGIWILRVHSVQQSEREVEGETNLWSALISLLATARA
jgi:hypothetical protein